MKKLPILLLMAILSLPLYSSEPEYVYTDARTLTVGGKICEDTYEPFSRLPARLKDVSRGPVWTLGRCSSGLYVKFASDAGEFKLRWTSTMNRSLQNMAAIGVRGLSLYVFDKGEWVYIGAPKVLANNDFRIPCRKLAGQMREYLVYLSLYDGVKTFEIGVPEGCSIRPSEFDSPKRENPVIIYGTSILQGASASHPGMAGTNMLSRRLDREVINLGFSGNALLDYEIAELMAAYPTPGVYVMDNIPNGSPELTHEKLGNFVKILRDAHPLTPIVFVEGPIYPGVRFDTGRDTFATGRNEALREEFKKFKKAGMKNIYLVPSDEMLLNDNIGTIEGTHFTDIGFTNWTEVLYPTLKKLYRKL